MITDRIGLHQLLIRSTHFVVLSLLALGFFKVILLIKLFFFTLVVYSFENIENHYSCFCIIFSTGMTHSSLFLLHLSNQLYIVYYIQSTAQYIKWSEIPFSHKVKNILFYDTFNSFTIKF